MSDYDWDTKMDYLRKSRESMYNDDYLEFLVKTVWKIQSPVNVVDFGCGYGFLGLKLLPLLPEGSTYTGIDLGEKLLNEARKRFAPLPYRTVFLQEDIQDIVLERTYHMAICQAVLLHMPNPVEILEKMRNCVVDGGRVITFEPHWISNAANSYLHGYDQLRLFQLGFLQKLYNQDAVRSGKDGNIGGKVPVFLSQLGLKDIECRVSDKVYFLHPQMEAERKSDLHAYLLESGYAAAPREGKDAYVRGLVERGATLQEAEIQYENELFLSTEFHADSYLTYASTMKIAYGRVAGD